MTTDQEPKETRILRAVKRVLTDVIKDTASPPGTKHPLSDATIENMRQCLALIAARERELAQEAGDPMSARPRFTDEPDKGPAVVPLSSVKRRPAKGSDE
jgi:hypothetical protein